MARARVVAKRSARIKAAAAKKPTLAKLNMQKKVANITKELKRIQEQLAQNDSSSSDEETSSETTSSSSSESTDTSTEKTVHETEESESATLNGESDDTDAEEEDDPLIAAAHDALNVATASVRLCRMWEDVFLRPLREFGAETNGYRLVIDAAARSGPVMWMFVPLDADDEGMPKTTCFFCRMHRVPAKRVFVGDEALGFVGGCCADQFTLLRRAYALLNDILAAHRAIADNETQFDDRIRSLVADLKTYRRRLESWRRQR